MRLEAGFIGKRKSRFGIWIEIVVHVYGIDVVSRDDIFDNEANPMACFVKSGFEIPLFSVLPEPIGMQSHDMVRDELGCVHHANRDAIRIEPGVDLHIPVVGFGDDKFERVVLVIYSGK